MEHPSKNVLIGRRRFDIAGVGVTDPYFAALRGRYDPGFDRFCAAVLRADDVCVDIGANIGLTSLVMAGHVPAGRVVAVEASPTVGRLLTRNVAAVGNVTVVQVALGEEEGRARFADQSAYGHIAAEGVEVRMRTLGAVAEEAGLGRLDFIKIDIEGHEFPVLRGAWSLIERHRPVVFLEFNAWCQIAYSAVNPVAFAAWLLERFSHVYEVRRQGGRIGLVRVADALGFAHRVIVGGGAMTDVVATNAPERLAAVPAGGGLGVVAAVQAGLRWAGFEVRRV